MAEDYEKVDDNTFKKVQMVETVYDVNALLEAKRVTMLQLESINEQLTIAQNCGIEIPE